MLEAGITSKSSQNTVAARISWKAFSLPPNPSDHQQKNMYILVHMTTYNQKIVIFFLSWISEDRVEFLPCTLCTISAVKE